MRGLPAKLKPTPPEPSKKLVLASESASFTTHSSLVRVPATHVLEEHVKHRPKSHACSKSMSKSANHARYLEPGGDVLEHRNNWRGLERLVCSLLAYHVEETESAGEDERAGWSPYRKIKSLG